MVQSASEKTQERARVFLLLLAGALFCTLADIVLQMIGGRNARPLDLGEQAISFVLYTFIIGLAAWTFRRGRALWVCIGISFLLLILVRVNLHVQLIADDVFLRASLFLSRSILLGFSIGLLPFALLGNREEK